MDRGDIHDGTTAPRRRKVLVLIKCMGHGGAEQLVVSMVRHRDRERFDYEVAYVLESRNALVPRLRDAGVPVHSLGALSDHDLRWTRRLRTLLADGGFDVVHAHLPYAATLGRLVAATLPSRPALVYTDHGMWNKMALAIKALNRATIGLDDQLLVVSEAARRALPTSLRRQARVVVHGIELEPIAEARLRHAEHRRAVRRELGVPDDALLALTVANFRWQKGYDVLLRAAASVVARGIPVRFAFVGDGALRHDLEQQRAALSLDDRVQFLGERDDVSRLLAAADLFVLPSRFEGLPLALMEAISARLPVVATAVGEIPTLLSNGSDALLVPAGDPAALADAVSELAGDAGLRDRLATAALRLSGRFDIGRCVREVEAIYDELRPEPAGITP